MDNVVGVEKRESYSDVMTDIDLDVVGDWLCASFHKVR